jgi:hypothetical protein
MKDRPRALAVLVAIFLIGIILGTAGSYFWFKPSAAVDKPPDNRRSPSPKMQARPRFPFDELNLTSEQVEQFREIGKDTGEKFEALGKEQWKYEAELAEKRNRIWEENNNKIRSILNEEQKVVFDDFLEKSRYWFESTPHRMGPETPKEKRKKPESSNPRKRISAFESDSDNPSGLSERAKT